MDLVAFGVARDCDPEDLGDYLNDKGIEIVNIECLTKQELLDDGKVRAKTMKVTVKGSDLEKAKDPEIWPYRVGVRHLSVIYRVGGRQLSVTCRMG